MLSFGEKLGQNIESVKFDMGAMLSTHEQRKLESYMYTNNTQMGGGGFKTECFNFLLILYSFV